MQQRASFGRKGQGSEEPERRPISFGKADEASEMDRRREAFIAAERARRQQEGEHVEPAGSDDLPASGNAQPKSIGTAYLLWFLLGQFAAHRFYVGSSSMAFAQISLRLVGVLLVLSANFYGFYLLGAALVWWAVDGIMLPDLIRKANARSRGTTRAFA